MDFSRQEYWNGLPCLPPEHLPQPGMEPVSLPSPALAGRFFTTSVILIIHLYLQIFNSEACFFQAEKLFFKTCPPNAILLIITTHLHMLKNFKILAVSKVIIWHIRKNNYLTLLMREDIETGCMISCLLCPTLCDPMDYISCQAPLSVEFSQQEHWSGLPFLPPGNLPKPGIKPSSLYN